MKVHIMIGLPASGKTTLAIELQAYVLSSDKIRLELFGDESIQGDPKKIFDLLYQRMEEKLKEGRDVVVDATNLNVRERSSAIKIAQKYGAVVIGHVMKTPIAVCIRRNDERERKVPDEVYDRMLSRYETPTIEEGFDVILCEQPE